MLLKREIRIGPHDTGGSLHAALAGLGAAALLEALEGLAAGTLEAQPQPALGVTYAAKVSKSEARIDWSRDAIEIERQVRAFDPWPVAETRLDGQTLRIHSAEVQADGSSANAKLKTENSTENGTIVAVNDSLMIVQCGRGLLAVRDIQKPGGRVLAVSELAHNLDLVGLKLG
jgi:methionyl-tRNA formyltransferase